MVEPDIETVRKPRDHVSSLPLVNFPPASEGKGMWNFDTVAGQLQGNALACREGLITPRGDVKKLRSNHWISVSRITECENDSQAWRRNLGANPWLAAPT